MRSAPSPWRRFLALPARDRRLWIEAWFRLAIAAVRLRLSPRRALRSALEPAPAGPLDTPQELLDRCAWAVASAAAHHVGPKRCLPRSLALRSMLAARGAPARVAIGVRRNGERIEAHAWVEADGVPVAESASVEERFLRLLSDAGSPGA